MTDLTSLRDLAARLERATGPDRELDDALMALSYTQEDRYIGTRADDGIGWRPVTDRVWVDPVTTKWVSTSPGDFTASIDAALAIVWRLLPGWDIAIFLGQKNEDQSATLYPPGFSHIDGPGVFSADAPTPALAILKALVAALIAKKEAEHG